jgi:hypothetical protein
MTLRKANAVFGRKKAKRIKDLEEAFDDLRRLYDIQQHGWQDSQAREFSLRNQVDFLIREIRKMDDIIFSMGQTADGSWPTIRPRFQQLHDQMTARKVAESNRIGSLLTQELHSTYTPPTEPKQIGSK